MGECFLYGQKGEIDIPPKSLAEESWEKISEISLSGKAAEYWQVGDEKNITANGETLTLVIVGFNHDDLTSGGKAGITFGMKNLMSNKRVMNSTNTNVGSFFGSELYTWLNNDVFNGFDSQLQNAIKSVNKKTSEGNKSTTINTNAMKLFLFSEEELTGTTKNAVAGEGTQYDYFSTANVRIKYLSNGIGNVDAWWTRSPIKMTNTSFSVVNNSGDIAGSATGSATYSTGVCFGFCV